MLPQFWQQASVTILPMSFGRSGSWRGCGTCSESPDWSTGKPDFDNPKIGVNSHLFDEFDLDAVPVTVIDGKNLW